MVAWPVWTKLLHDALAAVDDGHLRAAAQIILASDMVLCVGNGGSAALASHAAQAITKPSFQPGGGRPATCLCDGTPTIMAFANDCGWQDALVEAARPFVNVIDKVVLLAISSSGRSENIVRAAKLFADRGKSVIAFTGFTGEPLRSLATVSLHVDAASYEHVEAAHDALLHRVQEHIVALGLV